MKPIIITIILASALSGCAVTTSMNIVSYTATGKSITDHVTSTVAQADCDGIKTVTHGTYYCEQRDIAKTYNRNGF
jgi:hypothetical protein